MKIRKALSEVRNYALETIGSSKSICEVMKQVIEISRPISENHELIINGKVIPVIFSSKARLLKQGLFPYKHYDRGIFLQDIDTYKGHHFDHNLCLDAIRWATQTDYVVNQGKLYKASRLAELFTQELRRRIGSNIHADDWVNDFSFIDECRNNKHGNTDSVMLSSAIMDIYSFAMNAQKHDCYRLRIWGHVLPVLKTKGSKGVRLCDDIEIARHEFRVSNYVPRQSSKMMDVNKWSFQQMMNEIFEHPHIGQCATPDKVHAGFTLSSKHVGIIVPSPEPVPGYTTYELMVMGR